MKKKKLKLNLKKDVISNLQAKSVVGGDYSFAICLYQSVVDYLTICDSDQGCTLGPDETMTCPAWGC